MIQPACLSREKCSLLAFSPGLSSFFWLLESLESLSDNGASWSKPEAFDWLDSLAAFVESSDFDEVLFDSVSFACELKDLLAWKNDCFGLLSIGFKQEDSLDPTIFASPVFVSLGSKLIGFLDWKKGKLFGFLPVSAIDWVVKFLDPCSARSVCCCVIFSSGASSVLESSTRVSMYFMCCLFCRNPASSRNFSSLTFASGNGKEKAITFRAYETLGCQVFGLMCK